MPKKGTKMSPIGQYVLNELSQGQRSLDEISLAVGREKINVSAALSTLIKRGKAVRVGKGVYSLPRKRQGATPTNGDKAPAKSNLAGVRQRLDADERLAQAIELLFPMKKQTFDMRTFLHWVDMTKEMMR